MTGSLETLRVDTGPDPAWSVIWLHGLGADGHDFEPIVAELDLPYAVRFIFPHAPVRPVTINGGYPMRAWYDILSLERDAMEDEAGIRASAALVRGLVDDEAQRGLPASRVIVAGFSQGGAIALHVGLRQPVAGIIALSTYLPLAATLSREVAQDTRAVPIFMAHGTEDPTVPESFGVRSRDQLREAGHSVDWHAYPMGHSVCAREIADINDWLRARLLTSA